MDDLKKKFLKVTGTIDIKCLYTHTHLQGGPKKTGILVDMAKTPVISFRKGKSWCISEKGVLQ